MSDLTEYQARRDFARTAEPPGNSKRSAGEVAGFGYVIHKHAARQLHYDLRLELGGVLLSWAVPKGPSLNPGVKRLAIEVEPHPLEYGTFEGEIAPGQYGAGAVIVWDAGSWRAIDDDPRAAYEKGHLAFALSGHKLKGTWHLVRTARGKSGKSWLLFKANDEHADAREDILKTAPESVVSGLSVEQVSRRDSAAKVNEKSEGKRKRRPKLSKPAVAGRDKPKELTHEQVWLKHPAAKSAPLPSQVDVQLATLAQTPPQGDDWLHEIKFDGYRVVVYIHKGDVRLRTRKGLDWTHRMPALATAFSDLGLPDAVIDGEFVALDASGVSQFQMLQNALTSEDDSALVYYAFDLLYYDRVNLSQLPLIERKSALKHVLTSHLRDKPEALAARLRLSEHVRGNGTGFYEQACKWGLEGIVSKRAAGAHVGSRSRDWLKVKCSQRQEFVIVGYTEPAGSRSHLGALLVAVYDGPQLVYCGRVGTGFTRKSLTDLHTKLEALHSERLTLRNAPKGAHGRGVHWVQPSLVAEVEYLGFTDDGILRHPTFQGLREDKPAKDVYREDVPREEQAMPKSQAVHREGGSKALVSSRLSSVDTSSVKLTNPDKLLYPDVGITKRQLLDYLALVAPRLLPHVRNRPLTLVRCPNGQNKPCFFQKHPNVKSAGLRSVAIREKEGKADYAVIDDARGLFSLVQLGVLEIHTCGSQADDYEHPDILVFDLDPDPSVAFSEVVRCARRLRELFDGAQLESFVKTTGGKGLHVCVPIEPRLSWDEAKSFTQKVAKALVTESPERYVATQSKALRRGKIFIDYLRNGRGATFVAPYSMRAQPAATVATPLFWEELTSELRPDQFTVQNIAERLSHLQEDPFARMATLRQKLPGVV